MSRADILQGLLVCLVMILTLFIGFLIEHSGTQVLQEAGTALLIGLGAGYGVYLFQAGIDATAGEGTEVMNSTSVSFLHFDNDIFFNFILPPIIFSAGYTMRKRKFFSNFGTIILLGVVGSIITVVGISAFLYGLQSYIPGLCSGRVPDPAAPSDKDNDAMPCIILGTILCNVDLVATLGVMSPTETPQLYSILFGEGVINDAVSIVLFDAALAVASDGLDGDDGWGSAIWKIMGHFILLLLVSTLLGVLCGLLCSFFFKRTRVAKDTKRAVAIFALFAYLSYLVAEVLEMSGIISVFFCGVVMAHYNWHRHSEQLAAYSFRFD
jgi:sodium/hydrogen exchanger 8